MVIHFFIKKNIYNLWKGSNQLFLLFETSSGYSLFERLEIEEITEQNEQLQQSIQDSSKFIYFYNNL